MTALKQFVTLAARRQSPQSNWEHDWRNRWPLGRECAPGAICGRRRAGRHASVLNCRRARSGKCCAQQACAGPMTDSMLNAAAASGGSPAPRPLGISCTAGPPSPRRSPGAGEADEALARLDDALAELGDGDLHRAHSDGGWTVAQVISHIPLSATLWLGTIKRLENDAELDYLFREELGHDAVGYPPPSIGLAAKRSPAPKGSASMPTLFAAVRRA